MVDAYLTKARLFVERSLCAYEQCLAWEFATDLAGQKTKMREFPWAPLSTLQVVYAGSEPPFQLPACARVRYLASVDLHVLTLVCGEEAGRLLERLRPCIERITTVECKSSLASAGYIRSSYQVWFDDAFGLMHDPALVVEKTVGFWWKSKKEFVQKTWHPSRLRWCLPHDDAAFLNAGGVLQVSAADLAA